MTIVGEPIVEPDSATVGTEPVADLVEIDRNRSFGFDVAILGLGYVGLPTALAFSAAGRRVLGIDIDKGRLAAIRREQVDLLESDRDRLSLALNDDKFQITDDLAELASASTVIVCVPTPVDRYLIPDLSILRAACKAALAHAVTGQLLVLTSTTYVGSTRDMLATPLAERGFTIGRDVFAAFSPERIDPGNDRFAHEDVPRVIGGVTAACTARAIAALSGYARNVCPVSSAETAEMTKLLENTFRAVNIAMVNEFAEASRALDIDVMEVISAASTKPYGFMRFTPGPGVGGHCIPCDPHYLLWQLRKHRLSTPVIERAMQSIAGRPSRVIERAREVMSNAGRGLAGSRVLLVGVAYKPDVEDIRESPALEIAEGLLESGAIVDYYDPYFTSIRLADGHELHGVTDPSAVPADLVIVHTLHSGLQLGWIQGAELVLDTTYRLDSIAHRVCL
jgi:UDP-N-acetyl-D-glucosamine dehydrogenase